MATFKESDVQQELDSINDSLKKADDDERKKRSSSDKKKDSSDISEGKSSRSTERSRSRSRIRSRSRSRSRRSHSRSRVRRSRSRSRGRRSRSRSRGRRSRSRSRVRRSRSRSRVRRSQSRSRDRRSRSRSRTRRQSRSSSRSRSHLNQMSSKNSPPRRKPSPSIEKRQDLEVPDRRPRYQKRSSTSPGLNEKYQKVLKTEKAEKSRLFAAYPREKSEAKDRIEPNRKSVMRKFVVLPHEKTTVVPDVDKWTIFTALGIGVKSIRIFQDASTHELKDALFGAYPLLEDQPFVYAKAVKGEFEKKNFLNMGSNMQILLSLFRNPKEEVFILPMGCDMLLPKQASGVEKVKCKRCCQEVFVHELVNHTEEHDREEDGSYRARNYTRKKQLVAAASQAASNLNGEPSPASKENEEEVLLWSD